MMTIALKHAVRFADFNLDIETEIPAQGITGVFGASGSGKTTLLRCIAGLEQSAPHDRTPVHRRRIGFVFQQPQLFLHMSVRKNIEYGLHRNAKSGPAIDDIAAMLDINNLLDRAPRSLSGGEAQRVSIARVLCQSPRLILMDEPLSAVDERRRNDVLPYLDRLHTESAVPIIYVSHNIDEICRLSDHLLVLDDGKVVAEGELQQVLAMTNLPQLAGQNAGAVVSAVQAEYDVHDDLTAFDFPGGRLWVTGRYASSKVRLRVRASDVSLSLSKAESSTILNILPAEIRRIETESAATLLVSLQLGEAGLVARITRRSSQALNLRIGDRVFAQVKSVTVRR